MREEAQDQLLLNLLNAVERDSTLTQRTAARELGIALGLANTYLRRCARKGLIKIQQVPANRYAYYLTAQGFGEKARLTAKYLSVSFGLIRTARQQFESLFRECAARGQIRVVLGGVSDLAEIAALCAREFPITILGIVDPNNAGTRFAGLDVVGDMTSLLPVDVIIVTDMSNPQLTRDALLRAVDRQPVLAPTLLGLSSLPIPPASGEGSA